MAQNWTLIIESIWIFSLSLSLSLSLSIYIYIYIYMTYKFKLFLVIQKNAHKYKIIQTLSSSNFIYSVRYMIMFFYDLFILDSSFSTLNKLTWHKN